jgi:hypothetical protein
MSTQHFYLVGDDVSTAQAVQIDTTWKLEDLKRAVGLVFHVSQPTGEYIFHISTIDIANRISGITFHADPSSPEITTVSDVLAPHPPISLRIDGQAVQSPQGPQGLPIVGFFYEIFPDHLGNHYRLFRKYGPVIKTTNMGKTIYLTDSPEVAAVCLAESAYMTKKITVDHPLWGVKDNTAIFVGDTETENWRLAHKYLPASMGPKAISHYTPHMQQVAKYSFNVFDELDNRGESWNVYQYMLKLASQTIGKFALGQDFKQFESPDSPVHPIPTNIATMLSLNKKVTARGAWYQNLPFGDPVRLKQVRQTTYTLLQEAVDDVKASGKAAKRDMPLSEAALEASCVVDYLLNCVDENGQHFPDGLVLANMLVVAGAGFTPLLRLCPGSSTAVSHTQGNRTGSSRNSSIIASTRRPNGRPTLRTASPISTSL